LIRLTVGRKTKYQPVRNRGELFLDLKFAGVEGASEEKNLPTSCGAAYGSDEIEGTN
jgi:hypothetical protein